jgi:type II secretory pathway pseudopilin PulG
MNLKKIANNQSGQVLVIILLIVVVALAIGLSIAGRSLTGVTTATRLEQSTRAFSAAEAGLEQALIGGVSGNVSFENQAEAEISERSGLPQSGQGLEFSITKESCTGLGEPCAQFWLQNPIDPSQGSYTNPNFVLFFGNPELTQGDGVLPALSVTVITQSSGDGSYNSRKYFLDPDNNRAESSGFTGISPDRCRGTHTTNTTADEQSTFFCWHVVQYPTNETPIMARVRLLYSDTAQKIALVPTGGASLPNQARIITSTGRVADVQRRLQLMEINRVVPFFFDYAIFSAGPIQK